MRKWVIKTAWIPFNVSVGVKKDLVETSFMNTITKWEPVMKKCFQVQTSRQSFGAQKRTRWILGQLVKKKEAVKWQRLIGSRLKRSSTDYSWGSREGKWSMVFKHRPFGRQLRHVDNVFLEFYIHNGTALSPEDLQGWIICESHLNHQFTAKGRVTKADFFLKKVIYEAVRENFIQCGRNIAWV